MKNLFTSFVLASVCLLMVRTADAQWTQINTGLPTNNLWIDAIVTNGTFVFVGLGAHGIYRTADNGGNWEAMNNGFAGGVSVLRQFGSVLLAGTNGQAGIYTSSDNAENWTATGPGGSVNFVDFAAIADTLFGINALGGIFRSINDGTSWEKVSDQSGARLAVIDRTLFVGASNGVSRSDDGGLNWNEASNGITGTNKFVQALGANGNTLFVQTQGSQLFISQDKGSNWSESTNWPAFASASASANNIVINEETIIIATQTSGLFASALVLSQDNGQTWTTTINSNLPTIATFGTDAQVVTSNQTHIFTGIGSFAQNGVFRHDLADIISSVHESETKLPSTFSLQQNYPNPFNPATTITYSVSQSGEIELKIFDILGKEVRTLVHENQSAGEYSVLWNGKDNSGRGVASGNYFYQITAGDFQAIRKLLLLK